MSTNSSRFEYENLSYKAELEIRDPAGRIAVFRRSQRVRVLSDGLPFYVDRMWGDGVIMDSYVVTGALLHDAVRLRNGLGVFLKFPRWLHRGDVFEFSTSRRIVGVFTDEHSYWDLAMGAPTRLLTLKVSAPPGLVVRKPEVSAPRISGITAIERPHGVDLQVRDVQLDAPYRIEWDW
jgi:hypothetical protein